VDCFLVRVVDFCFFVFFFFGGLVVGGVFSCMWQKRLRGKLIV